MEFNLQFVVENCFTNEFVHYVIYDVVILMSPYNVFPQFTGRLRFKFQLLQKHRVSYM